MDTGINNFLPEYVIIQVPKCGIERGVLFDIRNPWNSGGRTALRDYVLSDFVRFLQKSADLIWGMDKLKSAVYNASYTTGIHLVSHRLLRESIWCQYVGFKKSRLSLSLFVLHELAAKFRLCQKKKIEICQAVSWSVMFRKST